MAGRGERTRAGPEGSGGVTHLSIGLGDLALGNVLLEERGDEPVGLVDLRLLPVDQDHFDFRHVSGDQGNAGAHLASTNNTDGLDLGGSRGGERARTDGGGGCLGSESNAEHLECQGGIRSRMGDEMRIAAALGIPEPRDANAIALANAIPENESDQPLHAFHRDREKSGRHRR